MHCVNYVQAMSDPTERDARTVDGRELLRDARAVLLRAEAEGPVTVTDASGGARMVIYVPSSSVPFNDD